MILRALQRMSLALLLFLCAAAPALAQDWNPADGLILQGKILTQDEHHRVIEDGLVCIKNDIIQAVIPADEAPPVGFEDAAWIETHGVILPGLISAHNHVAFNFHPIWEPPELYENRYRWATKKPYKAAIMSPKRLLVDKRYFDMQIDAVKYGEIKALVGGTTSLQGAPPKNDGWARMLVRNIDYGLEIKNVYNRMPSVDHARFIRHNREGGGILANMENGKVAAWLVHLAEGIDEKSRNEFDILDDLGLIRDETVMIHGTALGKPEFKKMAAKGVDLVWSPLSNRLLYGQTTDIPTARAVGVNVSLAPDWSLGGSKNLLGELKVADEIDNSEWGNILSYRDLVDMATINPAIALKWDDRLGRIKPGYLADILVLDDRGDPYGSVVHAVDSNVSLVLVGGDPLYGDDELMHYLKGDDVEEISRLNGRRKCIDITKDDPEIDKSDQTFEELLDGLDRALKLNRGDIYNASRDKREGVSRAEFYAHLDAKHPNVEPVTRTPIYAHGDNDFFNSIRGAANAGLGNMDLKGYWDRHDELVAPEGPEVLASGEIGGSLRNGRKARLYGKPRGWPTAVRLSRGTPLEILERKSLSARSKWVRVRTVDEDGDPVEGWISTRYVDETAASSGLSGAISSN